MITKIKINSELEHCMDLERLAQKYELEFECVENNEYVVHGACENTRNELFRSEDVKEIYVEDSEEL